MQLTPKLEQVKDAIQEKIIVVGAQSTSLKTTVLVALVCLVVGIVVGIRMDFSGFKKFREKAQIVQERQRSMNRALLRELERMREANEAERSRRRTADSRFEDATNKPGPEHCLVPVGDVNPIIEEAGQ